MGFPGIERTYREDNIERTGYYFPRKMSWCELESARKEKIRPFVSKTSGAACEFAAFIYTAQCRYTPHRAD